jgi:hypothetical protein
MSEGGLTKSKDNLLRGAQASMSVRRTPMGLLRFVNSDVLHVELLLELSRVGRKFDDLTN